MTGDTAWLKLGILVEFMPTGGAHTPPPFSAAGVGQQMSSRKNKSCVNRRPRSHMDSLRPVRGPVCSCYRMWVWG